MHGDVVDNKNSVRLLTESLHLSERLRDYFESQPGADRNPGGCERGVESRLQTETPARNQKAAKISAKTPTPEAHALGGDVLTRRRVVSQPVQKAPRVGLEPTTFPLTAGCSTIELSRNGSGGLWPLRQVTLSKRLLSVKPLCVLPHRQPPATVARRILTHCIGILLRKLVPRRIRPYRGCARVAGG